MQHEHDRWMAALVAWRDYGEPPPDPNFVGAAAWLAVRGHELARAIIDQAAPEDRLRAKCTGAPAVLALAYRIVEAAEQG